jgi:hypothetical protein
MNEYGYSAMMSDYTLLEDIRRKVGDWGMEIVRGGYSQPSASKPNHGKFDKTHHMRDRRSQNQGKQTAKRNILKTELELLDITMELQPVGMERRKMNQSNWDSKYVIGIFVTLQ